MIYDTVFGNYTTRKFSDIFVNADEWMEAIQESPLYTLITGAGVTEDYLRAAYYLMYSRYGNSHIATSDETQFICKIVGGLLSHAPAWVKSLHIQSKLCTLSDDELLTGAKHINNHSFNPSTEPSTASLEELPTVNDQYSDTWKKSNMDAYGQLMALLSMDLNEEFLRKFAKLFIVVTAPQQPLWYTTEEVEQ